MSVRVAAKRQSQGSWWTRAFQGSGLCVVLVLSASCRVENPGYFKREPGTDDTSYRSDAPVSEESSETELSSAQGSTGSEVETSGDQPSSSASSSSSSGASTSSSSSGDSSTQAPKGLCGNGERHCYEMELVSQTVRGSTSQSPDLIFITGTLSKYTDSVNPTVYFASFLRFNTKAVLATRGDVSTGANGVYGFDLTLRHAKCLGQSYCGIARSGNVVLELDTSTKKLLCISVSSSGVRGKGVSLSIDLDVVNTVGCSLVGNDIRVFVNAESDTVARDAQPTLSQVRPFFGADTSLGNAGQFSGDIGRFRYWNDPEAMKREMETL